MRSYGRISQEDLLEWRRKTLQSWNDVAKELDIESETKRLISNKLNIAWQNNKVLLSDIDVQAL